VRVDLVVFDEAHYLADEDRGHVWEEAIILTPSRIRMLCCPRRSGTPPSSRAGFRNYAVFAAAWSRVRAPGPFLYARHF
jgi:hypothetical protein